MTSGDLQRCCEAVRSAILATAWLLVTSLGTLSLPLISLILENDGEFVPVEICQQPQTTPICSPPSLPTICSLVRQCGALEMLFTYLLTYFMLVNCLESGFDICRWLGRP